MHVLLIPITYFGLFRLRYPLGFCTLFELSLDEGNPIAKFKIMIKNNSNDRIVNAFITCCNVFILSSFLFRDNQSE